MHIALGAVFGEQYSWAYWLVAISMNLLICFGCWWLARESGRNEALAILWGLLCGLLAFLVYLFLWARDTGGKVRRKPGQYYPEYLRAYTGPGTQTPDPYYPGAPDGAYTPPVMPDRQFSYDSAGAASYCPRCGIAQGPESQFCPQCGERLPAIGQPITAGPPQYPPTATGLPQQGTAPMTGAPPPNPTASPPTGGKPPVKPKPSDWK
jgi:hypothetical protein